MLVEVIIFFLDVIDMIPKTKKQRIVALEERYRFIEDTIDKLETKFVSLESYLGIIHRHMKSDYYKYEKKLKD